MPPVGLITFVVSGVPRIPLAQVFRSLMPFIAAISAAILLMIVAPDTALWLS